MRDENLFAALNPNVVQVDIVFRNQNECGFTERGYTQKRYTYKALKSQNIEVNDFVIVPAKDYYQVVRVVRVLEVPTFDYSKDIRWVCQKLDTSIAQQMAEKEAQFNELYLRIERDKKRDELRNDIKLRLGEEGFAQIEAALAE